MKQRKIIVASLGALFVIGSLFLYNTVRPIDPKYLHTCNIELISGVPTRACKIPGLFGVLPNKVVYQELSKKDQEFFLKNHKN